MGEKVCYFSFALNFKHPEFISTTIAHGVTLNLKIEW